MTNIIGAAIAFAVALLLSFANYLISRAIMKKSPQYYSFGAIIHQAINVAYMVLLYFIAPKTPFDAVYLLVGAVLGITAGLVLFTSMLLKNTKKGK
ncbi:MAG: hypothetical protein IKT54_00895 [Clostridia bacterium]|nr:hypothetical protein [Clostridia bacterium]